MSVQPDAAAFDALLAKLDGQGTCAADQRVLYSTDASIYQEHPIGVVWPKSARDCQRIVAWAAQHQVPIIPRAGGTSLAGQCVGAGLVIDTSRYLTAIRAIDSLKGQALVQPGVIQDDLNDAVAAYQRILGPDTSTSDRCTIGGMIGNNACGARSIVHGTTREHLLRASVILSDGSTAEFGPLNEQQLEQKKQLSTLEGAIYRRLDALLRQHSSLILKQFPKPAIVRRNTGYCLDELVKCHPYTPGGPAFNLCRLLCGSEGTLALVTESEVNLELRPAERILVAAHFTSIADACTATVKIVDCAGVSAVELMDKQIIDAARNNEGARRHMHWIEGDPEAVLGIELSGNDAALLRVQAQAVQDACASLGFGYAFPRIAGAEMASVWAVRKAGLGLLMGIPGDVKTVTVIEDAAVAVADLPGYVRDVGTIMQKHGIDCCHYGHASVGLLHLRPNINLKQAEGRAVFTAIAEEVAQLVRRYGGSLSGEHGDGRLRSAFIEAGLGREIMALLRQVKQVFDPNNIFNPGKIIDAPPIDAALRVGSGVMPEEPQNLAFDWSSDQGLVRATEKCNGAGACRKSPGRGTMCPSYQVTRDEKHSTRGRANIFRQLLHGQGFEQTWDSTDLQSALELCLSCKGCKTECPSSVDMARLKAEWQHQHHHRHGVAWRDRLIGDFARQARLASRAPRFTSWFMNTRLAKRFLGIHPRRSIPAFAKQSFTAWYAQQPQVSPEVADVVLYVDHFTNFQEPKIAQASLAVLTAAGFQVYPVCDVDDGRTWISKGLLTDAARVLRQAVIRLGPFARRSCAIVGCEPSAVLSFVDEAPGLLFDDQSIHATAQCVAQHAQLFEQFITAHWSRFAELTWRAASEDVLVHGHCHQKALVGNEPLLQTLSLIAGDRVHALASGCCGMAGSFGYAAANRDMSMHIGEQILFPALRAQNQALVCAPGTSCRHQILDGVARAAQHPAVLLYQHLVHT